MEVPIARAISSAARANPATVIVSSPIRTGILTPSRLPARIVMSANASESPPSSSKRSSTPTRGVFSISIQSSATIVSVGVRGA